MDIFAVIAPLVLCVISGFLVKHYKKLTADAQKGLAFFVYYFGVPALLFQLTANEQFSRFLHLNFIAVVFISLALVCFAVLLFNLLLKRGVAKATFSGMNASMLNSALIGVPVLVGLIGQHAAAPLALINLIVAVIFFPLCIILIQIAASRESHQSISLIKLILGIAKKVVMNPVIASLMLGLIFSFLNWHLPTTFGSYLHLLALTPAPLAMFVVGMEIDKISVRELGVEVLLLTTLKLIVLPFIVFALAVFFKLPAYFAIAAVVGCAVPASKTIYIMSKGAGIYEKESAANVALSTVLSVITLPFFIWLAFHYWPVLGNVSLF